MRKLFLVAIILGFTAHQAKAQKFSETIASVGEEYARGYAGPLLDVIGVNFNAGLIPAAHLGANDGSVNIYIGVRLFGAFVPQKSTTFSADYMDFVAIDHVIGGDTITLNVPAQFSIDSAPSFFGDSEAGQMSYRIDHDTTFSYLGLTLPISIEETDTLRGIGGIWDGNLAPFLVPEVVFGTYLGTDLMVRWMPPISIGSSEKVSIIGFGLRHSLSPYLPRLPFDLAVQAVWQRAGADDDQGDRVVQVSTFAANVQVGKRLGPLGIFAALQSEMTNAEFRYDYTPTDIDSDAEPVAIGFEMTGVNKMRSVFGVDLKLGPLHTIADMSFGRVNAVSFGLGFMF